MRLSCNGCRVLRKGCTEGCTIRPCLQWIKAPEAQANATVFLAKFYGRAGLLNLIDAAPDDAVRPAVFRSLLYEACGRIVNPVYGSVGLLWSGSWHLCQAAVEAVLKGAPIVQISSEDPAAAGPPQLHKACSYDIRHVAAKAKPTTTPTPADAGAAAAPASSSAGADDAQSGKGAGALLHKVAKPGRTRFKRASASSSSPAASKKQPRGGKASDAAAEDDDLVAVVNDHHGHEDEQVHNEMEAGHALHPSQDSSDDTHHQEASAASMDTDASHVSQVEQAAAAEEEGHHQEQQQQPGLDLTLGFGVFAPMAAERPPTPPVDVGCSHGAWSAADEAGVVGFRFL